VISCHENKQYKKGIKTADLILKKFPNHGETLAMKGLLTNGLGNRDEAFELAKLGLRNGVRSHICWHVFGLLNKSIKNLKEASKCYMNALRIDPSNQNILRDLSQLQIQVFFTFFYFISCGPAFFSS
jgi:N-alpha-acetyltransferase 15/16, NatA auxiliary subunit